MDDDGRQSLDAWQMASGATIGVDYEHGRFVYSKEGDPHHAELWHLRDYAVSSVSGPVVWLVPR